MPRFDNKMKALVLVPLTALSVAWTATLIGVGTGGPANSTRTGVLPDGSAMPTETIEEPASVSAPLGLAGANPNQAIATASANGIPSAVLAAYQRAETVINAADPACNVPWQLIAAIGRVESDHGRYGGNTVDDQGLVSPGIFGPPLNGKAKTQRIVDTDGGDLDGDVKFDRAVGPMQFIPTTWAQVGVDADEDGKRNPQDIDDAALATAVYLCSGDEDLSLEGGQRAAVYRYNHSREYVDLVLDIMRAYMRGDYASVPNGVMAGGTMGPYVPGPRATHRVKPNKPKSDRKFKNKPKRTDKPKPTTPPTVVPTAPTTAPSTQATKLPTHAPTQVTTKVSVPTKLPTVLPSSVTTVLPTLPVTSAVPTVVSTVLSTVEAVAKCTAEGKIDNPLDSNDPFDRCVYDYTH